LKAALVGEGRTYSVGGVRSSPFQRGIMDVQSGGDPKNRVLTFGIGFEKALRPR
jgi:hypothetical protein